MKRVESEILRRYIRESLLVEDDIAGVNFGGYGQYMSGVTTQTGKDLGSLIAKTGGGVGQAIAALGEKGLAAASRIAKVGLAGLLSIFTGLDARYDKIHQEYESKKKSIDQKYGEAIKRSWKILGDNAALAAIMGFPAGLSAKAVLDNPQLAGAALAWAGAGGVDGTVKKVSDLLLGAGTTGSKVAAATFTTGLGTAAGEKTSQTLRNESKKKKNRIILEVSSADEQADLEKLWPAFMQKIEANIKGYKGEVEDNASAFANQLEKLVKDASGATGRLKQIDPSDDPKKENQMNATRDKIASLQQKIAADVKTINASLGGKGSQSLNAAVSSLESLELPEQPDSSKEGSKQSSIQKTDAGSKAPLVQKSTPKK